MTPSAKRAQFFALHAAQEVFVMPNPFDVGSAKLLAHAGFPALATTSAGLAWSLGQDDYGITLDDLVTHVAAVAQAVEVPLNVDGERLFANDLDGVAQAVRQLHQAGAAGCSIEDFDPATGAIDGLELAVERVAAAAEAAHADPTDRLLLTARCEHFLHGIEDLDATIARLVRYRDAGADCVYAPGLTTANQIREVVAAVGVPVNVLAWPSGPSVAEIAEAGGRRVSIGSGLASTAYAAVLRGARELLASGTSSYRDLGLTHADRAAFG